MMFWWFMFGCNMLYSLCMIVGGRCMWKHHGQKVNSYVGYRSKMSKMNEETWAFANENCGKRWWIIGWIMLVPTILVQLPLINKSDDAIGNVSLIISVIECFILMVSIIPTERALKLNFNKDGTRKI